MLEQIREPLLAWYRENKRSLPWREDPTPYHVWVSEIMLQQTRVEAVKEYYARFLFALPEVKDLAECPEERLLKLWEGLGYYNRVKNMQKAAREVMEQYDGRLPADYEKLLKLPGIGRYKAGGGGALGLPAGNRQLYGRRCGVYCLRNTKTCGRWKCTSGNHQNYGKSRGHPEAVYEEKDGRGSSGNYAKGLSGGFQSEFNGTGSYGLRTKWYGKVPVLSGSPGMSGLCTWHGNGVSKKGSEKAAENRRKNGSGDSERSGICHFQTSSKGASGRAL